MLGNIRLKIKILLSYFYFFNRLNIQFMLPLEKICAKKDDPNAKYHEK